MKKTIVLCFSLLSTSFAQVPTGEEVLGLVDANMTSLNRIITSKMVIHGRRGTRTIESRSWTSGEEKSFTEYTAPPREKGVKMLKLGDRLWIYSPSTDRIIEIAGHMLRQSVMGSDLSYEDMMEDPKLLRHYNAAVNGTESMGGRTCWVLELTAKGDGTAYQSRRLWVDTERHVPLRQELYAKGGKLLKRLEMSQIDKIDGRWYPRRFLFKDALKEGEGTEFWIQTVAFDQAIPEHFFSKAALR